MQSARSGLPRSNASVVFASRRHGGLWNASTVARVGKADVQTGCLIGRNRSRSPADPERRYVVAVSECVALLREELVPKRCRGGIVETTRAIQVFDAYGDVIEHAAPFAWVPRDCVPRGSSNCNNKWSGFPE